LIFGKVYHIFASLVTKDFRYMHKNKTVLQKTGPPLHFQVQLTSTNMNQQSNINNLWYAESPKRLQSLHILVACNAS